MRSSMAENLEQLLRKRKHGTKFSPCIQLRLGGGETKDIYLRLTQ